MRSVLWRAAPVLIAIAASSTGCGGSAKSDSQGVTEAVNAYLAAQVDGDGKQACSYLTDSMRRRLVRISRTGQRDTTCAQIESVLRRGPGFATIAKHQAVTEVRVNGRRAEAHTKARFTHGSAEGDYRLVKVGGGWKITRVFANSTSVER